MTTRVALNKVVVVEPNPSKWDEPITLKVVLEIFEKAPKDCIEAKFTWSPIWDFSVDQELDELEVGPFATTGKHEFLLQSDPPDVATIPDPTGPTALLVSFRYHGEEFLHLGFNVAVSCEGEIPDVFTSGDKLVRHIGRVYSKIKTVKWDLDTNDDKKRAKESLSSSEREPESKKTRKEE